MGFVSDMVVVNGERRRRGLSQKREQHASSRRREIFELGRAYRELIGTGYHSKTVCSDVLQQLTERPEIR